MTDYKHEVRRPTDYNNGQIHGWNGGECPVHPETVVKTWHRVGIAASDRAGQYWWEHSDTDGDIIAFQVVKQHVEPKVIWVNEYVDGHVAFNTERSARNYANAAAYGGLTRIAVKYQEVKE